jgi:hypothetical protein
MINKKYHQIDLIFFFFDLKISVKFAIINADNSITSHKLMQDIPIN